ncbi:MBT domain-containing protein 1-like isoform X2 [Stegodyphus dumicola]|uniref:MBT domain-containing protein 1-like isoform X2 n=1 Tax=Stegodyphus dumicola TaxID=202533 RepID=UPI0015AB2F03|nr:MBT domain-containing protein 1-like isoform X2 [Stegodyphus dumicola]
MIEGSFNWRSYLSRPNFVAAPVSCFNHVALSRCWDSITAGILVEVRSPDCTTCCASTPCCYWIAAVIKVSGYLGLLRYEGFDTDDSQDMWVNLCTETHIHPIGWCADNGMPLVPPKCIEDKHTDWKDYLVKRISRARTIPADFAFKIEEHKHNIIKKGMKLEVVDKNLISAVRVATVSEVIGGRLHIKYEESEQEDEGFWCHERSPLIHPVGWAQIIGHALKGKPEYARLSLRKTLYRTFDPSDATWDMFLPVFNPVKNLKFKEGMKLEAIDPLNLSTICVATVTEVLRNNYLMIGIDGMMAANGSDCFCYHASSPCIFPVGFCESNGITLMPPRGYKGEFKWQEYLKKTKSKAAPVGLFHREIPNHGFKEGMYLEAVDLMEPRLICVASVTKVVGRLLRVHFDGWDEAYDQWCDCESPDLFPVGWCEILNYRLEPPRSDESDDSKKKRKSNVSKHRRKKKEEVTFKEERMEKIHLYHGLENYR